LHLYFREMAQKPIEEVIMFQLDQAVKATRQYSQKEMDKMGLGVTVEQWVLLKIIHEKQPLTQRELAHESYRDPASITRTLDLLEKKGLILREAVEENKRSYHISLTKSGTSFIDKNMELIYNLRQKSTDGLNAEELKELSRMLKTIKENMT
jgi:MarR family transcriptional regulator, transcriptional regulator for hemolysin